MEHDVYATNKNGDTPLHRIMDDYSDINLIKALLEHGANVNALNENEYTPLRLTLLRSCSDKKVEPVVKLLIMATLLANIQAEKPKFIDKKPWILSFWAESEIILKGKLLNHLSLLDFCKEQDENKLARISRNEAVKKIVENLNVKETHPYLFEKIQGQFQTGLARNKALVTACNSIFTFNDNKELNEDCWKEILKHLSQEELKSVTSVASLFVKKSPADLSTRCSAAASANGSHDASCLALGHPISRSAFH